MTGDPFLNPDRLTSLDDALAMLSARLQPVTAIEDKPLLEATGRVLAQDSLASHPNPPFDNSAMDGFALRLADLATADRTEEGRPRLPVTARVAAGAPLAVAPPPGQAVEIFTGAKLPPGLDCVVPIEDCRVEEGGKEGAENRESPVAVVLPADAAAWTAGRFIRKAGADFETGQRVLQAGRRITPRALTLAAALGLPRLPVHAPLRVAVFSTGDEIVEPGLPLHPGQIYGSNRYGMLAQLQGLGCVDPHDLGHLPDCRQRIRDALAEAAQDHDVVLTSGGVSVGGEDHVRAAVEEGGRLHLWRLALKPGKPVALGELWRGERPAAVAEAAAGSPAVGDLSPSSQTGAASCTFIGLPGNPVSALVGFMILARPVLLRLAGATAEPFWPRPQRTRLARPYAKTHKRREFLRASLLPEEQDGLPLVAPFANQDSNALTSLTETEGLLDIPAEADRVAAGTVADFYPFEVFG